MWVARHSQSTQNNKFAISLQYSKENMNDEVEEVREGDFLLADKHEIFLQIDSVIIDGDGQAFLNSPK